jgi:hypothetical protein
MEKRNKNYMNNKLYIFTLFIIMVAVLTSCNQKPEIKQQWYKGNLHTHSYWSDGDEYPEMIMDWYKSRDYNFVGLSDHNILADHEKWVRVAKSKLYEDAFENYLQKYGEDWVKYKLDSGRTDVLLKTYEQYKPLFEDENFLIIQSEEITDRFGDKPIHMNVTNVRELINPQGGESVADVMQRNVNAVLKQRNETGIPMFPHINHPNFFFGVSMEDIMKLKGERFFEVYNGHLMVNNYGDSTHPGTEQMWDMINIDYLKKKQPLLLGLATDDSHSYHQFGSAYSNAGRGWVMVLADSLTPSSLIRSLEAGSFYASTGVKLEEIVVDNNVLRVAIAQDTGVNYKIQFIGVRKGEEQSSILKEVSETEAEFQITEDFLFVRSKIISDKVKENPFQDGDVETAWTQPVVFSNL